MKYIILLYILSIGRCESLPAQRANDSLQLFTADNSLLQYTGRIDFTDPKTPRCWMGGIYLTAKFEGRRCVVLVNDEMLYGKHNYIEIAVDDQKPVRLKLTSTHNEIEAAKGLSDGNHIIAICKNTEAGTGFIEFAGVKCRSLKRLRVKRMRKIECIGNSITCGTGSDQSEIPCGKGVWEDQHNAYMSYGAVTARNCHAQYHLSSVSGIGLMHSCCKLTIVMRRYLIR